MLSGVQKSGVDCRGKGFCVLARMFKGTLRRIVADGCLRRRMSLIRWMSRPRILRFQSRGIVRRVGRGVRARVLGRRRVTGRGRVGRGLRLRMGGLEGGT